MKLATAAHPNAVTPARPSVLARFGRLSLSWFALLLLARTAELAYNGLVHDLPSPLLPALLAALLADLRYFLYSSCLLGLVYAGLAQLSVRGARVAYVALGWLLLLIQGGLIAYFAKTSVPLGADLYSYSLPEIRQTVGAAGGVGPVELTLIALLSLFVIGVFAYLTPRLPLRRGPALALFGAGLLAAGLDPMPWLPPFRSEFAQHLVLNKSAHLAGATFTRFSGSPDDGVDIYADAYIGDFGDAGSSDSLRLVRYVADDTFPFLHTDETPDVLSPFFRPSPVPPNVVILVVEGLGRAFTGADAYLGSFTPFVDSLAQRSLYWENFLSEGGRTFAVLPALLGSLPFGEQGFSDLGGRMPDHLSLTGILRKNGYQSAFYYGGSAQFDNMGPLLRKQGIGRIVDETTFGAGYRKMPGKNGFTWGYGDKELFRHYFALNSPADPTPKLQVLLTVSTHDPFSINEQETYLRRADARIQALPLSDVQQQDRRKYRLQLASVLYTDDALKEFFARYRQRPDFERTIFLITGDHRMPEIPMTTKLDRYHVPLIVYSPLLTRPATFRSISTHFDVAPSLLAFLRNRYQLRTPPLGSWLGVGIDTTRQFRNVHAYPLKMTKAELVDFVMGPYMLSQNNLYRIGSNMDLEPSSDPAQHARLTAAFDAFRRKNGQFSSGARLVPDSLLNQYN